MKLAGRARALVLSILGADWLVGRRVEAAARAGVIPILNFHRIDDDKRSAYPGIDPAVFDAFVGWLSRHFDILTIAELDDVMPTRARPVAVLSFDDGYADFARIVVPILARHRVRANQNVIPVSVESGLPPINVMFQDFVGQAPSALLAEATLPGIARGTAGGDREALGRRVSTFIKALPIAEQRKLWDGFRSTVDRLDRFKTTPMMTIADVRSVAETHEIGAHSYEHATMTAETDAYVASDMARCRTWFSDQLGLSPRIYAFPNGAHGSKHVDIAHRAGFDRVLLVDDRLAIRNAVQKTRLTMYGENLAALRFRALGGFEIIGSS